MVLSQKNINSVVRDFGGDKGNKQAIQSLENSQDELEKALILNCALCSLMLLGFLIDACTIGKQLRVQPKSKYDYITATYTKQQR